tara:strand:+ start:249 stop:1682 length:1434 start_codon:yes stop_codon:yes gene_type:complete
MEIEKPGAFYSKSDLFIIFYVSAYFLNEAESWNNIYSSLLSLTLLIFCLISSKYRYIVFILFLIISSYFIFNKYPRVSNHSTLILFVNIFLFLSLISKLLSNNNKLFISDNDFLVLRWSLIIVYFFTGFHKLNYDFLFSEYSCANWYHTKLLFNITNQIIKPYPEFIYIISPFLVVILEITESIGLMFRRTQLIGLYSFILLHIYLSLGGFIDFAAVCISLMIAFIPSKSYQKHQHVFSQEINLLFVKIDRLYFYVLGLISIGIIVFFERTFNIIQSNNHRIIVFISGLLFILNLAYFSWYFIQKVCKERIFVWQAENLFYKIPIQVYSFMALLLFQGSQNYLGLSTAGTFSMFSNLRTEGGSSNHLILKHNPIEIFDFQKDLVYIEKVTPPYYKINYTTNNIKNKVIPRIVFEEYLYNLNQINISNVDIVLEYNRRKILERNILRNTNWTPTRLDFRHKYLYFREIQLSKDVVCVW